MTTFGEEFHRVGPRPIRPMQFTGLHAAQALHQLLLVLFLKVNTDLYHSIPPWATRCKNQALFSKARKQTLDFYLYLRGRLYSYGRLRWDRMTVKGGAKIKIPIYVLKGVFNSSRCNSDARAFVGSGNFTPLASKDYGSRVLQTISSFLLPDPLEPLRTTL